MGLAQIIDIIEENCVNCHACISVCPVKYCNDGSKDHVTLNSDLCIGCGECLKACKHDARIPVDDWKVFKKSLEDGDKMVAIVAPSIVASFPDTYLNINGWLKYMGIQDIFDVSFGAELSVKSYLDHLKKDRPKFVITQPCPAIVSYIEIYMPELLKYLAPVDSPMLHTIKMIKQFYPDFKDYKIVAISPCTAKKREFEATVDNVYNVTFRSIENYFKKNKVDLTIHPKTDYSNPEAERAVIFSTPGGLIETTKRWFPDIGNLSRKIEGPQIIYNYFKELKDISEQNYVPKLIDCLNCEKGCNGGTGTTKQEESPDKLEFFINKRRTQMQAFYQKKGMVSNKDSKKEIEDIINSYWDRELYRREYKDRSDILDIKIPTDSEKKKIYLSMNKDSKEDHLDCMACGYGSCEDMAIAIFNGLNKAENCYLYREKEIEKMKALFEKMLDNF